MSSSSPHSVDQHGFNQKLLAFLDASPTPFHCVAEMSRQLTEAGFTRLEERAEWNLSPGGYFVTRNDGSIVAFRVGSAPIAESGWRILGAHTDSPCLRLKPNPEINKLDYLQLGVEVYGGALLNPWFDRDLGLAGRINYRNEQGQLSRALVDSQRAIGIIPSLAIHLDRDANESRSINRQTDLPVLISLQAEGQVKLGFDDILKALLAEQGVHDVAEILAHELSFYDIQGASQLGWQGEFIASARLDNLLSCFIGLQALLACDDEQHAVLVCNDHEEVGSMSSSGASGPMLESVLRRIAGDEANWQRAIAHSSLISVDNAHGIHPNFSSKHDANHGPILNKGAVIKVNTNQRYASNSETMAAFRELCARLDEPVQCFVVRSDMACGSTIGPLTASAIGVATLDIGVPTFAMHSIRELAGNEDAYGLSRVLTGFYQRLV